MNKSFLTGQSRTDAQKKRDKNNHGILNHGQPLHHTTDPRLHLQRALKTIRDYMAIDPKLREANRRGVQTRAKNSIRKISAARAENRNAGTGEENL